VRNGQALTLTATSHNTAGYWRLLDTIAAAIPTGGLYLISDNLASHKRPPIEEWRTVNPRVHRVFMPVGACWLNLQEGWWRLLSRDAFAGQSFVDGDEITEAVRLATAQFEPASEAVGVGQDAEGASTASALLCLP